MPTDYRKLEQRIKSASANRRRESAAINELFDSAFDNLEGGNIAENGPAENLNIPHKNKAYEDHHENRSPVDTHNTPSTPPTTTPITPPAQTNTNALRTLIKTPAVQAQIEAARTQTKRDASTKATMEKRVTIPAISWKRAKPDDKLRYAGHATEHAGGLAFTLNLSAMQQKRLKAHKDPLRAFTDTLNRKLKEEGLSGIPYALSLEESPDGKLHVHGFATPSAGSKDTLRHALKAAGGHITGKAARSQLHMRPMTGAAGWAFYCRKDRERTAKVLAGKERQFLSRAMISAARELSKGR